MSPTREAAAATTDAKEFTARHRFAHLTARKARYVADLIRGRSVNQALELLAFTPNRGSTFYLKVLRSAIANASQDEHVNINRLVISECRADDGPLLQGRMRWRAGPQGRAMPFARRLSHLIVKVREEVDPDAPARRSIEPETQRKPRTKAAGKSAPERGPAQPAQPPEKRAPDKKSKKAPEEKA